MMIRAISTFHFYPVQTNRAFAPTLPSNNHALLRGPSSHIHDNSTGLVLRSNNKTAVEAASPATELESAANVVRKFYDGINRRDLASVEDLIALNCVYEDLIFSQPFVGRKAILDFFKQFIDSISMDLQFTIEDISEEDTSSVGNGRENPFLSAEDAALSLGCCQRSEANSLWKRLCRTCHQARGDSSGCY